MTAAGYQLRLLLFRQTALAPMLVYLALVAAIYASDAGPPVPTATVTAAALMPVCAWICRLVTTAESQPFAEITLVALGGPARRLLTRAAAVLTRGAVLTAITIVWALLANPYPSPADGSLPSAHPYSATTLAIIVGMSLAERVAGFGVGLLLAPPIRPGTAVTAVVALVIASLLIPWMPPLNQLLRTLSEPPLPSTGALVMAIGPAAGVGLAAAFLDLLRSRRTAASFRRHRPRRPVQTF